MLLHYQKTRKNTEIPPFHSNVNIGTQNIFLCALVRHNVDDVLLQTHCIDLTRRSHHLEECKDPNGQCFFVTRDLVFDLKINGFSGLIEEHFCQLVKFGDPIAVSVFEISCGKQTDTRI